MILNNVDDEHISSYGLDKTQLAKLLNLATCNNAFTFDSKIYNQIDGVVMGSPLAPVFADVLMGFNEKLWKIGCQNVLYLLNHFITGDM